MRAFVIDEGILHLALAGKNDKGEEDLTAVTFLAEVFHNRHRICWSGATLKRTRKKLKRWEGRSVAAMNIPLLMSLAIADVTRRVDVDVAGVSLPKGIPVKDRDWVRVALARRSSILVTQDRPLRTKIEKESLKARGVQAVPPQEGLELARDPDC